MTSPAPESGRAKRQVICNDCLGRNGGHTARCPHWLGSKDAMGCEECGKECNARHPGHDGKLRCLECNEKSPLGYGKPKPAPASCSEVVERLPITKHSGSPQTADSASDMSSSRTPTEIRKATAKDYWTADALVSEYSGAAMTCDCDAHVLAITELRQWLQSKAKEEWPCWNCGKPLYDSVDHGVIHVNQSDQCGQ